MRGGEIGSHRSSPAHCTHKLFASSSSHPLTGELASQLLPDPALAQALHVPVGHSAPETGRTSRPLGHAPAFLRRVQWKEAVCLFHVTNPVTSVQPCCFSTSVDLFSAVPSANPAYPGPVSRGNDSWHAALATCLPVTRRALRPALRKRPFCRS